MRFAIPLALCAFLQASFSCASSASLEYSYIVKFKNNVSFAISAEGTVQPQIPAGAIKYDGIGGPHQVGDHEVSYDSTYRIVGIGAIKIEYQSIDRVAKIGGMSVSYDKAGRLSKIGAALIKYDKKGNLVSVEGKPGADVELAFSWIVRK